MVTFIFHVNVFPVAISGRESKRSFSSHFNIERKTAMHQNEKQQNENLQKKKHQQHTQNVLLISINVAGRATTAAHAVPLIHCNAFNSI